MNIWSRLFSRVGSTAQAELSQQLADRKLPFVEECFGYPFKGVPDKRTASDFTEVADIDGLISASDYIGALALVQKCLTKHPDFYVFHSRQAQIYSAMGDTEKEKKAYWEALEKSLRKYYACDSIAQSAFEQNDGRDAVLWWVRACDLQLRCREMRYPRCFVCLAYVAAGLGDADLNEWFISCADQTPSSIDLNGEAASKHYQLGVQASRAGYSESFLAAFRELRRRSSVSHPTSSG